MTFPVVEIYCPECKEPMTLVNKPEIEDCLTHNGYDKQVDYHYQCKCYMSKERNITVMRILIPKLNLDNYSESVATTATVNMINIEKQMRDDGFKFHESKDPHTNLLLNIPTEKISKEDNILGEHYVVDNRAGHVKKRNNLIEELEKKINLVRKKYPNDIDYNLAFIKAGEKIIAKNNFSNEDIYKFFKDIAELLNPTNLNLPRESYLDQIGDNMKKFMHNCLDIILEENSKT